MARPTPKPGADGPQDGATLADAPQNRAPHDGGAQEGSPQDGGHAAESDVKRKFREALERKNAKHHASAAAGETGESKVGSAHGPQSHQKNFRRKSGG